MFDGEHLNSYLYKGRSYYNLYNDEPRVHVRSVDMIQLKDQQSAHGGFCMPTYFFHKFFTKFY